MMPATLSRGAVMDIVVWLRSLGLEKYEPVFRENEIDADVLPELTELDLENRTAW
jgi:SAM domain (Sterile alpha motif)